MASAPLEHQRCAWRHPAQTAQCTFLLLHRLIQSPNINILKIYKSKESYFLISNI